MNLERLHDNIDALMRYHGWTPSDLRCATNLTMTTILNALGSNGNVDPYPPSQQTVARIANVLGCTHWGVLYAKTPAELRRAQEAWMKREAREAMNLAPRRPWWPRIFGWRKLP